MSATTKIVLICTGLGKVNRGFEQYISALSRHLFAERNLSHCIEVWSGGHWENQGIKSRIIKSPDRNNFLLKKSNHAFLWEQRFFFLALIPWLLVVRPKKIYLGEFQLYCYLFKFRKYFGLNFGLMLYTGGQAIPGAKVFDVKRDFVHHVTEVYLEECKHIPHNRQLVLPHFINDDFVYSKTKQQEILEKAAGKKIVLSIGLLDSHIKRMDKLIQALIISGGNIFPVLLGEPTAETAILKMQLIEYFGNDGFIMQQLPHPALGDYFATADLFVLSSPKESFGLATVEALYHGLPVICEKFPESKFVLGNQVFYSNTGESKILAQDISKLLSQQKDNMAIAERQSFVQNNYTWALLKQAYVNMFENA